MQWESVLAWRVERQHLARRAKDALAVTSDLCGLHAQVMSSAQLTLWARMDDPPNVDRLLWEQRALVKTWTLRGTLHLLSPDELPLYTGAQAALKPRYEQKSWLKHFKLTPDDARRIIEGVPAALRDGPLTREELAARVHEGLRRGYGDLLKPVAFRGELIFADSAGQNVRFALPEPFEPMDTEEATKEITRRFLTRYGPASREELAKWFGSPSPAVCGRWIKALGDEVVETEFGWLLARDLARPRGGRAVRRRQPPAGLRPVRRRRAARPARDGSARADLPQGRLVLAGPARRRRDGGRLAPRGRGADDRAVRARRRRRAREGRSRGREAHARRRLAGLISAPRRRSSPSQPPTGPEGARSAPRWPSASASSSSTARSRPGSPTGCRCRSTTRSPTTSRSATRSTASSPRSRCCPSWPARWSRPASWAARTTGARPRS